MSKYSHIAAEFAKQGFSDSVKLNEYELKAALDKIIRSNMVGMAQFERDVAEELFQQTKKDQQGYVLLRDFIGVILQAHIALQQNIADHQEQLKNEEDKDKREDIQGAIYQFEEDMRILTQPFHLQNALSSPHSSERRGPSPSPVTRNSHAGAIAQVGLAKSEILATEASSNPESQSLVWVLIIAGIALPFQLLCAFVKNNQLNILGILMVLSILLLNYFDKFYIRSCVVVLLTSLGLDIVWLFVLAGAFWNPVPPTHRSTLRVGFLRLTVVMTIILMLARLAICVLIYRYRKNKPETIKKVKLGPLLFELSGNGANNPLSVAFGKNDQADQVLWIAQ